MGAPRSRQTSRPARPAPATHLAALLVLATGACAGSDAGDAAGRAPADRGAATDGAVRLGVDVLLAEPTAVLGGARIGLITNHTGLTGDGRSTIDALHAHPELQLVALFSPEHGIRGTALAGERVASSVDDRTGLPVHSLYGDTREPSAAMLEGIDALVFDIQDIGTRYYTYVWTMALAMRAAAAHDVRIVVLDRPNPIGGALVQGNVLDTAYATFVGLYPVPMRHGMTAGEIARLVNDEFGVGAQLDVIPLEGWTRGMAFDDTGIAWHAPSPSMPSVESALHYPGTCLFEGTNLSVGRGTPIAFQQVGAPWLDAAEVVRRLEVRGLPGVRFEAVRFTAEDAGDGKYPGVESHGVRFIATDDATYDPTIAGIAVLAAIHAVHADSLTFRESHFDRLAGTADVRHALLRGEDETTITAGWAAQRRAFGTLRRRHLLYPDA
jgi:uncharacterized protein YbbC (DUF1343 family)